MRSVIRWLAHIWVHHFYPRVAPLIAIVSTVWLGLSLLALYILAQLSEEVWEREAFSFDTTILLWIHQFANPFLDRLMAAITQLGNPSIVIPLTFIIFGLLWYFRQRQAAKIFGLNCLGGAILSTGLKLTFSKTRPQLWSSQVTETSFSYPSGHALGSVVLYGFLAYLLANYFPKLGKLIYGGAGLLIMLIGFSRLYLGVHWPTDVIAGYSVGFLWVITCIALLRLQQVTNT